ncbi:MAG: DUF6106 family protein [Clostridia bacterium]
MENYTEYLVKKNFTKGDFAKYSLIVIALLAICGGVSMFIGFASGFVVLIFGGYGAFYLATGLRREFEYVLTNDHLDVDVIVAGRSRKRLCGFDMEEMEICARVNDPDKNGEMKRSFAKTIEAASAPDAENAYFVIFPGEGGNTLLIFEPNDKILDGMSLYTRSKIFR